MTDADCLKFLNLLSGLQSSDANIRNEAETAYDSVTVPEKIKYLLMSLTSATSENDTRQLACVLLRRIFTSQFDEAYPNLGEENRNALKQQLLTVAQNEQNDNIRRKVADCIAELARKLVDDSGTNQWSEVLTFMFDCASSSNPALKSVTLHIFRQFPGIFGTQQMHYQEVLRQMLGQCMQEDQLANVRFDAACASVAFLIKNEENKQLMRHYQDLLPGILQATLDSAVDADDAVLKSLVELCDEVPKYVRPQVNSLIAMCLKIVGDVNIEESIRQLALETIVTLSETSPGLLRKQKALIPQIIPQMLAMMVDFDETEDALEWANVDDPDVEDDSDTNPVAGENALDRFACALGGQSVLPNIMATVPPMLQNPDWRYRHAALMAISSVGEGCHKIMEGLLPQIVGAILPYSQDPHPRVRYAACNCIGQMCTDFAPTMQKNFHEKIVVGLCSVLDDSKHPRVQAHAMAALVNFVEDCPPAILIPYLEPLCEKLVQVLAAKMEELGSKGTKLGLEQVTTTIAAVADTAEDKFTPLYDKFMPMLKFIMENAKDDNLKLLRGKTIECISLIGLAVGSEKFMPDAHEIMDQLLKTQADIQSWEDDDPQVSYMISAWARMCKLLGGNFVQYLPMVMGPLLKAAGIRPEVAMLDSQDVDSVEEEEDWEFINLGDQQSFGIRTTGMEEKATACQMLVCYARELKEGFGDYVEEVVKLMVPLLKFYFHDGVRASAGECIPLLLECAAAKGDEFVTQMWQYISPSILKAVNDEPDKEVLAILMESLAKCIELRGRNCFTVSQYEELSQVLSRMLQAHFQKQEERMEKRQDEDYDEQVEENLQDEDEDDVHILSKIADVLHNLFGTHGTDMFVFFDSLLPHYVKLIQPSRPWADRQWSICVFDDIIEYTGAQSVKYKDIFLRPLIEYVLDETPEVRQAAAYGIGVMAQFAGEAYKDAITEALPKLCLMVEGPFGRGSGEPHMTQDNIAPMENAISAVAKILKYQQGILGANWEKMLQAWLGWLPVEEDKEEAVHVYGFLCDLIESNNTVVIGNNNSNLSLVIALLSDTLYTGSLKESQELVTRVVTICKKIATTFSGVWNNSISQLPQTKQDVILGMLQ